MTTPRKDCYIRINALCNRFATAATDQNGLPAWNWRLFFEPNHSKSVAQRRIESPEACLSADFDTITSQSDLGVCTRSCYKAAAAMAYNSVYRWKVASIFRHVIDVLAPTDSAESDTRTDIIKYDRYIGGSILATRGGQTCVL